MNWAVFISQNSLPTAVGLTQYQVKIDNNQNREGV